MLFKTTILTLTSLLLLVSVAGYFSNTKNTETNNETKTVTVETRNASYRPIDEQELLLYNYEHTPSMQSKASAISVSSAKVTWDYVENHTYDISCSNMFDPNAKYDVNIRYNQKDNGLCYITGLRENTTYAITITDLTDDISEKLSVKTEQVTAIEEYDYVSGWTNCFAYEYASGLTHDPSKSAISGAVTDPVTGTGIMRNEYGDYCVAMGLHYGVCGDRFLVELENGVQFTVKICDSKGWGSDGSGTYHTFGYNGEGKNIIEFICDSVPNCVRKSGNYGSYSWDGLIFDNIKNITRIEYGDTITY